MERVKKYIFVIGSSGFIGQDVCKILKYNYKVIGYDLYNIHDKNCDIFINGDIKDKDKIIKILNDFKPKKLIVIAALKDLKECESNPNKVNEINIEPLKFLTEESKKRDIFLVFISSDQIFYGDKRLYDVNDKPNPLGLYGFSKVKGEEIIKNSGCRFCICRTSLVYGWVPDSQKKIFYKNLGFDTVKIQSHFVEHVLYYLKNNKKIRLAEDEFCSPTLVTNLADMIKYVCNREVGGVYHTAGAERISRYYFGIKIAEIFNLDKTLIVPYKSEDSLRPKDCSLDIKHSKSIIKVPFFNINEGLSHMRKSKRSIYYKIL